MFLPLVRKPPRSISPTGLQMALHGHESKHQNGGAQRTTHAELASIQQKSSELQLANAKSVCTTPKDPDQDGDQTEQTDEMDDWLKKSRSDDLLCGIDLDDSEMTNFKSDSLVLDFEVDENTSEGQLNVLEFREQDKNNTLMTPQELESMPERGLEFEESVGPIRTETNYENMKNEKEEKKTLIAVTKLIITNGATIQPLSLDNFVLAPQNAIGLLNNDKFVSLNLISNEDQVLPVVQDEEVDYACAKGKLFKCTKDGCDRVYAKKGKLKVHMMSHNGDRPFKCDIDGCDWAFATAYKMRRHRETHEGKKEYECPKDDCPKRFTTIYNLNTHKKLHSRPNTIQCPVPECKKMFPIRRLMEQHMKEHDDTQAPYKCPIQECGKEYYSPNSISTHMRVHQKTNLVCTYDGCGKKFDKACRLKQHVRQHTGERPYVCPAEDCNWSFVNASKLTRHMRKHTGDRRHVCPEQGCGKSFMRSEHLQGHMVVHSKSKPFQCEICKTRFSAKSSLYVHLKKHKEDVEKVIYPCPIDMCNKRYTCKSSLRMHMFKLHPVQSRLVFAENQLDCITLFANENLQGLTMQDISTSGSTSVAVSVPNITTLTDATLVNPSFTFQHGDILSENGGIVTQLDNDDTLVLSNEQMSVVATTRLLQENKSGSARTDFCSNHLNTNRSRRNQRQKMEEMLVQTENDVVLTTTAIAFGHSTQFVQPNLIQDDSTNVDIFHEDNLMVPVANPLLSESNPELRDLE